jgi:hypothetical protein
LLLVLLLLLRRCSSAGAVWVLGVVLQCEEICPECSTSLIGIYLVGGKCTKCDFQLPEQEVSFLLSDFGCQGHLLCQ